MLNDSKMSNWNCTEHVCVSCFVDLRNRIYQILFDLVLFALITTISTFIGCPISG